MKCREGPPSRARRLLHHSLPVGVRSRSIIGDLNEEYPLITSKYGGLVADIWYWFTALSLCVRYRFFSRPAPRRQRSRVPADIQLRGGNIGEASWRNCRQAVRTLIKRPGFTVVALLTLALGIGANTVVFSVVNGVLLSPLPYAEPHRLVALWTTSDEWKNSAEPGMRREWDHIGTSFPVFREWASLNHAFEAVGAYYGTRYTITGGDHAELVIGTKASAGMFAALGVPPELGRFIGSADDRPGAAHVAVLSYGLWQRRYAGDPAIIGRTITFERESVTVVGVMPRSFTFPRPDTEIWTNWDDEARRRGRSNLFLHIVARVRPAFSIEQAARDMERVNGLILEQAGADHEGLGVRVIPYADELIGSVRSGLYLLLGAAGLVLLIACCNVANLLLLFLEEHRSELAVRVALGAGRHHLAGLVLGQIAVLAAVGAGLGILLAVLSIRPLVALLPADLPRITAIAIDLRVLGFSLGLSLLTILVVGLVPTARLFREKIGTVMQSGTRCLSGGRRQSRVRSALVLTELALTFVLLSGATVLVKNLTGLLAVDTGFIPENLIVMEVAPPPSRYDDTAELLDFYRRLTDQLESGPRVVTVAGSHAPPFTNNDASFRLRVETPEGSQTIDMPWNIIFGRYFEAMGIPVQSGQTFKTSDHSPAARVCIINEALARERWPNQEAVGQSLGQYTVIGVVGCVKQVDLEDDYRPKVYFPLSQFTEIGRRQFVLVKTSADPEYMVPHIQAALWEIDRDLPIRSIATLDGLISSSLAAPRSRTILLSFFAWLAGVIAVVGVYGIMSSAVAQRAHEMGIRLALGAVSRDLLKQMFWYAFRHAVGGLVIGFALALYALPILDQFLYSVTAFDAPMLILTALAILAAVILGGYQPTRRISRIDPTQALRIE